MRVATKPAACPCSTVTLVRTLFLTLFLACVSLPLAAQHAGDTPELVTDQGVPTLRYTGYPGSYDVAYLEHRGETAFRFFGCPKPGYAGCDKEHGFLYVSKDRIVYESETSGSGFDIPRAELVEARTDRATIRFFLLNVQQPFMLVGQGRRNEDTSGAAEAQTRRWLALAISGFGAAEQEFQRLTASLGGSHPSAAAMMQDSGSSPEVVLDEGRPTIRFCGGKTCYGVAYLGRGGEPAIRFVAGLMISARAGCCKSMGFLFVGRSRITFEADNPKYAIDAPRAELVQANTEGNPPFVLAFSSGSYPFVLLGQERQGTSIGGQNERVIAWGQARRWLTLALSDFNAAEQEFRRMTASLQPNPPPQASPVPAQAEAAKPPPPAPPKLVLSTQPGNVGVYVDDEFKGISSGEGRLVVSNLEPGSHHLRFTVIGYKELAQSLDLAAGETKTLEAKLEPAGPKPLALAEIEEALTNGVPKVRVMALVGQFGVDFSLNEEAEQRLRKAGADSDLLLLITKSKK